MYLTKFAHYALDKLPGVKVYQFYKELSIPEKGIIITGLIMTVTRMTSSDQYAVCTL